MRKSWSMLLPTLVVFAWAMAAQARDLDEVKASGVLRHLGVPYANFVTGREDGLDVELIKLFAAHLGVRYEYVRTDWTSAISDLTGLRVRASGAGGVVPSGAPVRGDVIANGFTILPWRRKILEFSTPTFPTQVWLVARNDSPINPITPTGDIKLDIELTRSKLKSLGLLCKKDSCLDPSLFALETARARPVLFEGGLGGMASAMIRGEADAALLDVPDVMVAQEKYPGRIKIIGPMGVVQDAGVGFGKDSRKLRQEFDSFFAGIVQDGTYNRLVKKYFPLAGEYFPKFFSPENNDRAWK